MKNVITTGLLVVVALLCGYSLGHHRGIQDERGAWLATEQRVPLAPVESGKALERLHQRSHSSDPGLLTYYTDPRAGKVTYGGLKEPPINVPDPREIK